MRVIATWQWSLILCHSNGKWAQPHQLQKQTMTAEHDKTQGRRKPRNLDNVIGKPSAGDDFIALGSHLLETISEISWHTGLMPPKLVSYIGPGDIGFGETQSSRHTIAVGHKTRDILSQIMVWVRIGLSASVAEMRCDVIIP